MIKWIDVYYSLNEIQHQRQRPNRYKMENLSQNQVRMATLTPNDGRESVMKLTMISGRWPLL